MHPIKADADAAEHHHERRRTSLTPQIGQDELRRVSSVAQPSMTRLLLGLCCEGTSVEVETLPFDEPAKLRVLLLEDPSCYGSAPGVWVEIPVAPSIELGQIGVV